MKEQSPFDNRNLNDRIYYYIRDKIVTNELKPGCRIQYDDFMKELGVSRTPLRDALNRLQQDGLIEVKARSGTFVSTPKVKDIIEIYDLRKTLEIFALELSLERISMEEIETVTKKIEKADDAIDKGDLNTFFSADRTFHSMIIQNCNNNRLISIMDSLEIQIKWFGIIITQDFVQPKKANKQHKQMLHAIASKELAEAQRIMAIHLEETKQHTIAKFS